MKIVLLGNDNLKLKDFFDTVAAAAKRCGISKRIELITDSRGFYDYAVEKLPSLVVGNKIVSEGEYLTENEIVRIFDRIS